MNKELYEKCFETDFEKLFKDKGYKYFTKGDYNLNIIGIRSKESVKQENKFDDMLVLTYKVKGQNFQLVYDITTDPGLYYLKKTINVEGCAILAPGQYVGCWTIGLHQGKYEALCQCKPVTVFRDNNKDDILDFDPDTRDYGIFGINIHKAGSNSTIVNNWSAGCQVFATESKYDHFMRLCKEQVKAGMGTKFTYTLLEEKDLDNYSI